MTVVSCFTANSVILWIICLIVIGVSAFLLLDISRNISKLSSELEEIKLNDEIRQNNANHDSEISDEIKDVLEKLKIGFLGFKIEKIPNDSKSAEVTKLLNESMNKFNQDDLATLNRT